MAKSKNTIKTTPPNLEDSYVNDSGEFDEPVFSQTNSKKNKTSSSESFSFSKTIQKIQNQFSTNPAYSIIAGGIFILISIWLFLSFVSFFFTWHEDFDKVNTPLSTLLSYETEVQNWLGKFGALFSHIFIYRFFGIGSFFIPVALFVWGLRLILLKKTSFNLLLHTLFWLIWTSLTLSFFLNEKYPFAGGNYGEIMNATISNVIGKWGLLSTLAVSIFIYILINQQFFQWIKFSFEKNTDDFSEEKISDEADNNEIIFSTIDKMTKEESENDNEESDVIITEETTPLNNEVTFDNNETNPEPEPQTTKEPIFTIEQPKEESTVTSNSVEKEPEEIAEQLVESQGEFNPLADLSDYVYPKIDLLNDYGDGIGKINQEELIQNKDRIVKTLSNYGIEIQQIKATVGPTVTLYEIVPASGIRIARIKNLEDDIALSLAAYGIRIIAPMPGKGTVGIEVPNQNPEIVSIKNILASEKFQNCNYELPIALGKTINNEIYIADLAKMPHLLMAGATGQGKSVGINALLLSLLYKKHPAELKFVLVDPKKVELSLYSKIERHFLAKLPNSEEAIITDTKKVIHTLNSLTIEMDNRYALLQDAQVRNIKEYNQKFCKRRLNPNDGHRFLPYIVVVIDEFADLIMTAGKEVEGPIARLAQLARAIGIHLVIATQRPSVNIITGVIKANFPARIAFKVSSKIDSRTILDAGGAEQLIGRGDMLYSAGSDLIRLQCAFVDTPEVEKVAEFIGVQRGYPHAFLLPEYIDEEEGSTSDIDLSERDSLFEEAAKLVVQFQQGSASFLQRKLKIGFNRAGRLVDELEKAGIVGKFEGAKQREVLVKDMQTLEDILRNLNNRV
ncbi:MAG TPA: DNA translocase FtsK [Bacteroidia bacterium]|nr:DNA translocase FtsK [Bacteroidia bacterium]